MPVKLNCPECDATLTVPESFLGKTLPCKFCGETFKARPPRSGSDDDLPPRKRSPRSGDGDDERPQRKAGKKSKTRGSLPFYVGVLAASLLAIGAVGLVLWTQGYFGTKEKGGSGRDEARAKDSTRVEGLAPIPDGWERVVEGTEEKPSMAYRRGYRGKEGQFAVLALPPYEEDQNTQGILDILEGNLTTEFRGTIESKKDVTHQGVSGREYVISHDGAGKAVVRTFLRGRRAYYLLATRYTSETDAEPIRLFLSNFRFLD